MLVITTKSSICDKWGKMDAVVDPQSITSLLPGLTKLAASWPIALIAGLVVEFVKGSLVIN